MNLHRNRNLTVKFAINPKEKEVQEVFSACPYTSGHVRICIGVKSKQNKKTLPPRSLSLKDSGYISIPNLWIQWRFEGKIDLFYNFKKNRQNPCIIWQALSYSKVTTGDFSVPRYWFCIFILVAAQVCTVVVVVELSPYITCQGLKYSQLRISSWLLYLPVIIV